MSKRSWKILIEDIIDASSKIEEYTKDLNFKLFESNSLFSDAVVRNIEIIGEASKNIPEDFKNEHQNIP